jgi:hypothetical protein
MYVIGQFYQLVGNMRKCKECVERSLETYEKDLGREHSTTLEVKFFYKSILSKIDSSAEEKVTLAAPVTASAHTNGRSRRGSVLIQ